MIRCFATLCILLFHFYTTAVSVSEMPSGWAVSFANGTVGHIGVSLFFILSGYSLFLRWGLDFRLGAYCKSRFRAVFPLYWIGFGVLFCYTDLLHGARDPNIPLTHLIFSLLGMDGYFYGVIPVFYKIGEWFIGCILLLYGCFPLLLKPMQKHPHLLMAAALVLWVPWVWYGVSIVPLEHCFVTRLPEFLLGIYLARSSETIQLERYGWLTALPLSFLLWVPLPLAEPFSAGLLGAGSFALLYWALDKIRNPSFCRAARWLSQYSYAVFLVHHVVMEILVRPCIAGRSFSWMLATGVFVLYLLAALCVGMMLFYVGAGIRCLKQKKVGG